MWVIGAGAVEPRRRVSAEAMIGWVEVGMLAGEDQARPNVASRKALATGASLIASGLVPRPAVYPRTAAVP